MKNKFDDKCKMCGSSASVVLCFILEYDDNDVSEQLLSNTQKNCGIITNDLV